MRPTQQYMYLPQPGLPHHQLPSPHVSHLQHHGFMAGSAGPTPGVPAMGVPFNGTQYEYFQPGMMYQGGDPRAAAWMNLPSETRAWEAGVFPAQGRPEPIYNGGMAMGRDMVPNSLSGHGLHHVYAHPFQQPQMMTSMGILPAPHPSLPTAPHNGQPGGARWGLLPPRPSWYGGLPVPQELYQPQGPVIEYGAEVGAGKGGWRGNPQTGGRGKEGGGNAISSPSPSRPLQGAPAAEQLQCVACDRSFNSFQQRAAHTSTHVKCDIPGCTFEASTRIIREHKQSSHCKKGESSGVPSRVTSALSKEAESEGQRWQEERKRNYPTAENIKRKAEEAIARKSRGELVDEDARKRRERLKEILQRQVELGCPVAEVPDYILRDSYGSAGGRSQGRGSKPGGLSGRKASHGEAGAVAPAPDYVTGTKRGHPEAGNDASSNNDERPTKVVRLEDESQASELAEDEPTPTSQVNSAQLQDTDGPDNPGQSKRQKKHGMRLCHFFLRGRCKKGGRCEFLHERGSRNLNGDRKEGKGNQSAPAEAKRRPNLLAKLLDPEIQREKSQILQCLRFFVNNCFLLEYPSQPLEFFSWLPAHDEPECKAEDEPERRVADEPECEAEDDPECEAEEEPDCESEDEPECDATEDEQRL